MRKQGNISAMACYAYVLLYIVGALCIYGLASYIFDLGRLHDNMEIAVPFIWAGFTVIYLRHYVRILVKEWVRTIAYFVLLIALVFPLSGIQRYMHTLKSPTVYVASIEDAINKDAEYVCIDGEVKVDFANYGIYRTYQRRHHRHSSGIVFETYVVHPIAGAKNAYYGYCLESKEVNYTFSSEKQITSAEQEFYKSLDDSIAERTKETRSRYYNRVADNSDASENYHKACETCLGNPDNTQTPVIFEKTKMSEEESASRMLQSFFEAFLIALAVFTVIFALGKKNTKDSKRKVHSGYGTNG